jgi:ubiquinone/menaquinone biosynthesis C-methylase UbiE
MGQEKSKRVLNVGGGTKATPFPAYYQDWEHDLLDIDASKRPDILLDARDLRTLAPEQYDSVYCSHTLEHFYSHEVPMILQGFRHVLKKDGFAEIRVPDLFAVFQHMIEHNMDIEDILYEAPVGPITPRDVMYGYGKEIQKSGQDYYAHKTGFTAKSLRAALLRSGMRDVFAVPPFTRFELRFYAFKQYPTVDQEALLHLEEGTGQVLD